MPIYQRIRFVDDILRSSGNPGVCRQIPQSSILRNVDWMTHTCVISFETIGIWPEGADGTDVNNCTRSGDGKLLATGDDFGKVKLFSHPACQPKVTWSKLFDARSCKSIEFSTIKSAVIYILYKVTELFDFRFSHCIIPTAAIRVT